MPSRKAVVQARERAIPVLDAWMAGFNALDFKRGKPPCIFRTIAWLRERCTDGKLRIWTLSSSHG